LTLQQQDEAAQFTVYGNLNNIKVFDYPVALPGCLSAYQAYVCASTFPLCVTDTTSTVCENSCQVSTSFCKVNTTTYVNNTSHADLLPCSTLQNGAYDSTGACNKVFDSSTDALVTAPYKSYGQSGAVRTAVRNGIVGVMSFLGILLGFSSFLAALF